MTYPNPAVGDTVKYSFGGDLFCDAPVTAVVSGSGTSAILTLHVTPETQAAFDANNVADNKWSWTQHIITCVGYVRVGG